MIVSNEIRRIAAAAGFVNVITVAYSILAPRMLLGCVLLIAGAAVAGRYPHFGRSLMWFGAFSVSFLSIAEYIQYGLFFHTTVPRFAGLPILLVGLCDAALVRSEIRVNHERRSTNNRRLTTD